MKKWKMLHTWLGSPLPGQGREKVDEPPALVVVQPVHQAALVQQVTEDALLLVPGPTLKETLLYFRKK